MLTPERVDVLEEIGFDWGTRYGEVVWEQHFGKLVGFKHTHGHCRVPTKDPQHKTLGRWVSEQRNLFKRNELSEARRRPLDDVGFVFGCYSQD